MQNSKKIKLYYKFVNNYFNQTMKTKQNNVKLIT